MLPTETENTTEGPRARYERLSALVSSDDFETLSPETQHIIMRKYLRAAQALPIPLTVEVPRCYSCGRIHAHPELKGDRF
jgi:hypothetical protein